MLNFAKSITFFLCLQVARDVSAVLLCHKIRLIEIKSVRCWWRNIHHEIWNAFETLRGNFLESRVSMVTLLISLLRDHYITWYGQSTRKASAKKKRAFYFLMNGNTIFLFVQSPSGGERNFWNLSIFLSVWKFLNSSKVLKSS